jgi:hypothetical protein
VEGQEAAQCEEAWGRLIFTLCMIVGFNWFFTDFGKDDTTQTDNSFT